jgi:hypothetical protein
MNDYTKTVSITDYDMLSPTLARVVIAYTGRQTKESIRATILEKTDNLAAPVENSFRIVKANSVGGIAVGYLRANKEVRVIDEKEIRAGYRVMSSNIMMDNSDRSLWERRSDGLVGIVEWSGYPSSGRTGCASLGNRKRGPQRVRGLRQRQRRHGLWVRHCFVQGQAEGRVVYHAG